MAKFMESVYLLYALSSRARMARMLAWYQRENRSLRARAPKRITITRQERQLLLKFGKPLGKDIRELITIVHPNTFMRWVREERKPGPDPEPVTRGRRRTKLAIRRLICKLARENDWGYGRIVGELKKLGIKKISTTTVKNTLKARGLDPSPKRKGGTWDEFVRYCKKLWMRVFSGGGLGLDTVDEFYSLNDVGQ